MKQQQGFFIKLLDKKLMNVELHGELVDILFIYTVYKDGKVPETLVLLTINNGKFNVMVDE
jgi:hypothetical protein